MHISVCFILPLWMVLFIEKICTEVIVDVERDEKMTPVRFRGAKKNSNFFYFSIFIE